MQGTRLKVIAYQELERFEHEVNIFLSDLDASNLSYELSFRNDAEKHCAYISYSNPKLKIPIKENNQYCVRCNYFMREHDGCGAYCSYHHRTIKYGGFCCEEFYKGFGGVE